MSEHATPGFIPPTLSAAVDCVVFGVDEDALKVLLIERGVEPFRGSWAIPGGFVLPNESLEDAARRELQEETGLPQKVFLEQLYTFGDPARDPRGRVLSVAYYALVELSDHETHPTTDARRAQWFPVSKLPRLAFDHDRILDVAHERLRGKVRYEPIGFELLPVKFSLTQLQRLYEIVLGRELDKRNFRKRILAMELLEDTGESEQGVAHRAARLYSFDRRRYLRLQKKGFLFEL